MNSYQIELNQERLTHGCSMMMAFPYVITKAGKVVQYAKSEEGALRWIRLQDGVKGSD